MSRLEGRLKQDQLEKGIEEIILWIQNEPEQTNMLMHPKFTACSEKDQTITIEFPVMEWQLNPYSVMHGGMIATAFDEALGIFAAYLGNGKSIVSVNLSLNYLKPVPMNEAILITAKVTSCGKKIITLSGECHLKSSGLLTNTAIETFAIINDEPAWKV